MVKSVVQKPKVCKKNQVSEFVEMKDMIGKLRKIVSPFMPRERKVSKLEVIEHVIEYINELQEALESHPAGRGLSELASQIAARSIESQGLVLSSVRSQSMTSLESSFSSCSQKVASPQTVQTSPGRNVYC